MTIFSKLLGVLRPAKPNPDELRHDVVEATEKMSNVEASLESLRIRLDVMTHRRGTLQ